MEVIFNQDFWITFMESLKEWLITQMPSIVLLFVLLIISLRASSFMVKKLKKVLAKRTVHKTDEPNTEVEKRLNTLMGIVKKGIIIIIWAVFMMIFLKKINIDIAPLLAGAGIVGLAVGFLGLRNWFVTSLPAFLFCLKTKSEPAMLLLLTEPEAWWKKLNYVP